MSIEIKAPTFPESVADGTVANWLKKEGENVNQDEVIAEIETDKVVLEVLAQSDGVLTKIIKDEGQTVESSEVIGEFDEIEIMPEKLIKEETKEVNETKEVTKSPDIELVKKESSSIKMGPAAKKIISEENLDPNDVIPSGKGNRITKADLVNHLDSEINEHKSSLDSKVYQDRPEKGFLCLDLDLQLQKDWFL